MYLGLILLVALLGINAVNGVNVAGLNGAYLVAGVYVFWSMLTSVVWMQKAREGALGWNQWDLAPIFVFFVYVYGFTVGIAAGNQTGYVLRNFAALALLPFVYYLGVRWLSARTIFRVVLYSGLLNLVTTLAAYFFARSGGSLLTPPVVYLLGPIGGLTDYGHDRIWYASQTLMFPFWALLSSIFVLGRSQRLVRAVSNLAPRWILAPLVAPFLWVLTTLAIFALPLTKGHFLAGAFIFACLFFLSPWSYGRNWRAIFAALLAGGALYPYWAGAIMPSIAGMFSSEGVSNQLRYEQFSYLFNDATLAGKGLGAVIEGYARSDDYPYGFELIYLNVIHKFGLLGVAVCGIYILALSVLVCGLTRPRLYIVSVVGVGLMAFLFPSLGNPMLFSVQNIVAFALALQLIARSWKGSEWAERGGDLIAAPRDTGDRAKPQLTT